MQRGRRLRQQADRFAIFTQRFGPLSLSEENAAQIIVGVGVLRIDLERLPVLLRGLFQPSRYRERRSQVVVCGRGASLDLQRFLEMRSGRAGPADFEIEQRSVIAQAGIAGVTRDLRLVAVDILSDRFNTELACQRHQVRIAPRQHLNPQITHFIRRALTPACALWRLLRITGIVRRVIVNPAHRERAALRQRAPEATSPRSETAGVLAPAPVMPQADVPLVENPILHQESFLLDARREPSGQQRPPDPWWIRRPA